MEAIIAGVGESTSARTTSPGRPLAVGGGVDGTLAQDGFWRLRTYASVVKGENTVPAILHRPIAIFEGLRQDEDEDRGAGVGWRCYCEVPEVAYRPDGSRRPVYPGQVFLIFVNEECVAYNRRW